MRTFIFIGLVLGVFFIIVHFGNQIVEVLPSQRSNASVAESFSDSAREIYHQAADFATDAVAKINQEDVKKTVEDSGRKLNEGWQVVKQAVKDKQDQRAPRRMTAGFNTVYNEDAAPQEGK